MTLDKSVAERRRLALLLGTADARGSGLPVGPDVPAHTGTDTTPSRDAVDTPADAATPVDSDERSADETSTDADGSRARSTDEQLTESSTTGSASTTTDSAPGE